MNKEYSEFLKSEYWEQVRNIVLKRDGYKCTKCKNKKPLHVHHLTYVHHGEELLYLEDLITLCENCHNEVHKKKNRSVKLKKDKRFKIVKTTQNLTEKTLIRYVLILSETKNTYQVQFFRNNLLWTLKKCECQKISVHVENNTGKIVTTMQFLKSVWKQVQRELKSKRRKPFRK